MFETRTKKTQSVPHRIQMAWHPDLYWKTDMKNMIEILFDSLAINNFINYKHLKRIQQSSNKITEVKYEIKTPHLCRTMFKMAIRLNPVLVLGNSLLRDSGAPICSQERSAAFPEPRSKRCLNLSGAQITIHCYSFK